MGPQLQRRSSDHDVLYGILVVGLRSTSSALLVIITEWY